MSRDSPSYNVLKERLARAEAALEALHRGEEEREQAEQALLESKERFRSVVSAMAEGVVLQNANGEVAFANSAAERILGLTLDQMMGRTSHDPRWRSIHEDGSPFPGDTHPAMVTLRTGEPLRDVLMGVHKPSGELTWISINSQPLSRPNDLLPWAVVTTFHDITERKRAEEALLKSEEQLRVLFEQAAVGVALVETETGRFLRVNKRYCDIVGGTSEEMASGTFMPITHPDDLQADLDDMEKLIAGEIREFVMEKRYLRPDGSIVWVNLTVSPTWQPGEQPIQHIAVIEDISERKQAEAEHKRLMSAIGQAAEAIVITDTDGTIQYVNPAFEAVTGYSREEAIGQNPRILKSGKQGDDFYRDMWGTLTRGEVWSGRIVNKKKGGALFTEEAVISPVRDATGQTVNYVGVKRDITEHLHLAAEKAKLQNELDQIQKLESIGRLAGGVAHDFNNMLSVILGYGDMILYELHERDPLRDHVEQLMKAAERSADLTRQLLAFSRKQTLQPEVLNLNEVARNLEKMLRRLIGEDIELEFALSEDISQVLVDPGKMEQVIMNLAINARDAMPGGGKLRIETAEVELDQKHPEMPPGIPLGPHVLLAVTDTGCGMTEEVVSKVFEPFFTTKEKGHGTGLGLSTVHGIVKQSGGSILVDTDPGRGTTFKIYLPRTEEEQKSTEKEVEEESRTESGERILIVEDEEDLGKLIGELLSRLGYKVMVVSNGGEALLLTEERGLWPDLIITDVVMPNMSGKVLVNRLRKSRPDIKVLYISGYTDDAIIHHGVLDAGTPLIQKPFKIKDLTAKIRATLSSDSR